MYQYSIANTTAGAICVNNPDTGVLEAKLGPPSSSYMCAVSEGAAYERLTFRCALVADMGE